MNGGVQDVGGASTTNFNKLTILTGTTMTLSNDLFVTGSVGYLLSYGIINPGVSPSYKLTCNSARIYGKLIVNKSTFNENYNFIGSLIIGSGSIVDYASTTTDQIINPAITYSTLMISGSGVKSLTSNLPTIYSRYSSEGNIIVTGGTFDMASYTANRGTTTTGGSISVSNGATLKMSGNNFPSNYQTASFGTSSLVDYYGSSSQTVSGQTYGNLTLEGGGTKSTASNISVAGDFTIQSGTFSTSTLALDIAIGGSFIMNGGSLSGSNATYTMNGSSNQSLNLLSPLVNLIVNKTGGNVVLTSDVTVTSDLQFLQGIIQTDNNDLIVHTTTTITGAGENTGWVYGNLKRQLSAGSGVSKQFEVGSASHYSPALLTFSSITTGGNLTCTVVEADHPELDYSGIDPQKSINQYWSFSNEGISFTTTNLQLTWSGLITDAGMDFNTIQSGKFEGTAWSKYSVSTETMYTISISGITSLDATDFTAGNKVSEYHWTGDALSTDWFTPKNWFGGVPDSSSDVYIPNPLGSRRNYPTLTGSQIAKVGNLTVESDGSLIVDGGTLQINGNASNAGLFYANNGTIEFSGTTSQVISSGLFTGKKVKNLIISNDVTLAGADTVSGVLTVKENKTFYTNNNLTLKSDASGTARIAELPTNGSGRATAFIDGIVSIERYIPARKAWRLLSSPVKSTSSPTICGAWQEGAYGNSRTGSNSSNVIPAGYGVFIMGGSTANGFDQSPTNYPSVKYYDNTTNTFTPLPSFPGTLRPITDYNGYMIYIRGDRSINLSLGNNAQVTSTTLRVKGEVITGDHTVDVNASRFTVLGNPYASPINFGTLTKNNVKNSFYIWDPRLAGSNGLGAYVTVSYNSGSGTYDVTTSASAISQYIPSGEAVLIESADGVRPGTITVKETDKTSSGSDALFGRPSTAKIIRANLYEANADGNFGLLDASMTSFSAIHSTTYDQDDVSKMNGAGESVAFFRNGHTLAIERRKTISGADTAFVNLSQMNKRNYRLDFVAENMGADLLTAVVKDKYSATTNNLTVDLNGTTHVDFTVNDDPASYAADRFSIIFNASSDKSKTENNKASLKKINGVTSTASVNVYPNPVTGDLIKFAMNNLKSGNYTMKLYNITGQLVATQPLKKAVGNMTATMTVPTTLPAGKYDLKIEGEGTVINTSLIKE